MSTDVQIDAVGLTDVGLKRTNNEDAFVIADLTGNVWTTEPQMVSVQVGERGVLLAVSDGMGGAEAGEVASAMVVESLREHLEEASPSQTGIRSAVRTANRDVWVAGRVAGKSGMGATLTAVIVRRDLAHVASVGDSRAYIIRGNRIRQITKDQSYVAVLIQAGTPAETARNSPFGNMILQAMGTRPDVQTALGQIALRRGDIFLVCSDGLWDEVKDEECFKIVMNTPNLGTACSELVELAKQRGGRDNITVVLARVGGEDVPIAPSRESVTETYQTIEGFDPAKLE